MKLKDNIYPIWDEMICIFSEFLSSKNIMLINEDSDMYQLNNKLAIYGEDFRLLQDKCQEAFERREL